VALISERQDAVEEEFSGFRGDLDQLADGEALEGGTSFPDGAEVLAKDPCADLTDLCHDLAGAMVDDLGFFQAVIGPTFSEGGKMWDGAH
jgi:hypothetical protein